MPQEGMLLQLDGSHHLWLEDRGPLLTLLLAVDDATGTAPYALFQDQEDTRGYLAQVGTAQVGTAQVATQAILIPFGIIATTRYNQKQDCRNSNQPGVHGTSTEHPSYIHFLAMFFRRIN